MPKSAARTTRGTRARIVRAFTLVELLVVVAIITILMSLVVTAGILVTGGGRENQTLNTLRTLDQTLNSMVADLGRLPDPYVEIPGRSDLIYPVADARNMSSNDRAMINSVGLFLLQAEALGRPAESIKGLSTRIVRRYTPHETAVHENDDAIPEMPTIFDGFGNPIRYVHPVFQGELYGDPARAGSSGDASQPVRFNEHREFFELAGLRRPADKQWGIGSIRRNAQYTGSTSPTHIAQEHEFPDSDGGITPSQRPYFYSMGPSGRVGVRLSPDGELQDFNKDNLYTTTPRFERRQ